MKHLNYFNSHSEYTDPTIRPNVSYCKQEDEVHYNPVDYSKNYFTIKYISNNNSNISLNFIPGDYTFSYLWYSQDEGRTWKSYSYNIPSSLYPGQSILLKGTVDNFYNSQSNTNYIKLDAPGANIELSGNILSLVYGDNFNNSSVATAIPEYYFRNFIQSNRSDYRPNIYAENLIFPTFTSTGCFYDMFCNSLIVTAPRILPAMTLSNNCYAGMFSTCPNLTTAPELPATTLTSNCYRNMFYNCTSLNYIKAMFTTTPSDIYTENWVNGVSSTGTFIKNSAATWTTTGTNGIPTGWTVETASN